MNYYEKFISDVFTEWRYRTENGIPNIDNALHESLLRSILKEKKIDRKVISQIINSIREKEEKYKAKKKDTGHISTFTTKDKRDAAVKAGSHADVEKSSSAEKDKSDKDTVKKETETTPADDVLNTKNFTKTADGRRGAIDVNLGGTKVKFLFGKNVKKFRERLFSLLRGGGNQTLRNEAKNIRALYDALDNNDIDQAVTLITDLQAKGIKLGYNITSMGTGKVALQVRLGSIPLWTGQSFDSKDQQSIEQAEQTAGQLGLDKAVAASDSPTWKPQKRLDTKDPENQKSFSDILEEEDIDDVAFQVRPDVRESGFLKIGRGVKGRVSFAKKLQATRDEAVESMTEEELKAYDNYISILANENSTVEELEKGFADLVSSSINRPNEVIKNFGELHVAAMLTHEHPNDIILIPTVGNMSVSDVIRIKSQENKTTGLVEHIVIDVPVKARGSGVASSSVKVTHALVPTDEGAEEYNKAMQMLFHATREGGRGPEYLNLEDDPQSQDVIETMDEYLQDQDVLDAIETNRAELEDLIGRPLPDNLEDLSPEDKIAVLTRGNPNCKVFSAIFEKKIKPNIDGEATANQLNISEQDAEGKVYSVAADVNNMKTSSAKRRGEICTIKLV